MNPPSEFDEHAIDQAGPCRHEPPRGLVFESVNVLHDATVWNRWLWQLLCRMGSDWEFHHFCRTWRDRYLIEVYRGNRSFADAFQAFLMDAGFTAGQVHEVEAASAARRRELCETIRPLPGVAKTLNRLAGAGVVMGVLTDTELQAAQLHERFVQMRIATRFRFLLSSVELRSAKPDAKGYEAARAALGLPAQAVAFVGCAAEDLRGAAAIGMQTIAVNYEAGAHADHCLNRFDELVDVCLPAERLLAGAGK
jgi:HAD superfamily hydrolase (TIGR01509 family)